jgi:hypothetical protein
MQKSIIYYNDQEVKEDEVNISHVTLNTGYKVWIDLILLVQSLLIYSNYLV